MSIPTKTLAAPTQISNNPAQISDIVIVLQNIISLLAPFAGLAFFVMLLYGGYKFINSGGDPKNAAAARSVLTYAIVGVILVVVSYLLIKLIANVTGANVTNVTLQ